MHLDGGTPEVGSIHEARREMYRQQVMSAAEIEFSKTGFAATPMSAIAATAGLSLATVYKTFAGKAEIWDALHSERMKALLASVGAATHGESGLARLLSGVRAAALFLIENPIYLELNLQAGPGWASGPVSGHGVQRTVWSAGLDMIASGAEGALAAGEIDGIRPRVAAGMVVSALQVWLSDWVGSGRDREPSDVVDELVLRLRWMLAGR